MNKKKILWITNIIFPYPAEKLNMKKTVFEGWLSSLYNELIDSNKYEIAIATVYNGHEYQKFDDGVSKYYLLPQHKQLKYDKKLENYWKEVYEDFNPDIVNIHGSEFNHGLSFVNACPNALTIVSIQGLVSRIERIYFAGLSISDIIKNITIRDIIKRDTLFHQKHNFKKRGRFEVDLLNKVNYVSGRTIWDYSNSKAINGDLKFYSSNRILRKTFYEEEKWNIGDIDRHTIFCSQAGYPIKGIHNIIEALPVIKRQYPDVKLIIGGPVLVTNRKRQRIGYAKYVSKLIKKYGLQENIEFTGLMTDVQMKQQLLISNVFVQTSAIENSPNSLGEAMMTGTPCIASFVGGTSDMLKHNEEGFLYTYTEPYILAEYILKIFSDDNIALKFSENSLKKANITHNKKQITIDTMQMYDEVISLGGVSND